MAIQNGAGGGSQHQEIARRLRAKKIEIRNVELDNALPGRPVMAIVVAELKIEGKGGWVSAGVELDGGCWRLGKHYFKLFVETCEETCKRTPALRALSGGCKGCATARRVPLYPLRGKPGAREVVEAVMKRQMPNTKASFSVELRDLVIRKGVVTLTATGGVAECPKSGHFCDAPASGKKLTLVASKARWLQQP